MHVIDVLQRLWLATLVSSAALLVVAALRVPWRRAFGAEYACRLWWLPPLALAACMIPHRAAVAPVARMPARILAMVSWRDTAPADSAAIIGWPAILLGLWIFGAICVLAIAILWQWRYARGLRRMPIAGIAPPPRVIAIVRARDGATGPALIGAWRPRIVLPNDFEYRYDADERALILRHEGAHARRHDGLAGACARLLLAAFWFNPLAWWGERRLRRDQELACDAAVLREQPQARRAYADALLKTQARVEALPAGNFWPGHPITERIAMLKMTSPGTVRRRCGSVAAGLLCLGACAVAWATGQSMLAPEAPRPSTPMDAHGDAVSPMAGAMEYQLDLKGELVSTKGSARNVERVTATLCAAAGSTAALRSSGAGVGLDITPTHAENGGADIHVIVLDAKQQQVGSVVLHGGLGTPLHAIGESADGDRHYSVDVTPIAGCPARLAAAPAMAALPPLPPATPAALPATGAMASAPLAPLPPTPQAALAPLAPMASNDSRRPGVAPVAPPPMPPMPPLPSPPPQPPMPPSPPPPSPPAAPVSTGS